jgi:hypothetical protein
MTYEVGYRRPPPASRFQKGRSGNPNGRPKGARNFVTLLEQELAQTIVVTENGKKKSVSRLQAMVKRLVAGAMQGDPKQLLTLVEIMRKSGGLEPVEVEGLLPDNYEQVLDDYVKARRTTGPATERAAAPSTRRRPGGNQ